MKKSVQTAINIIKEYSWNSVFFKYLKKFALIIMIPFLIINSVIYIGYSRLINSETDHYVNESYNQILNTTNNVFDEINKYYSMLATDIDVLAFFALSGVEGDNSHIHRIARTTSGFISTSTYLDSIYMYSPNSHYVLSTRSSNYIDEFYDKTWYNTYLTTGNGNFVINSKAGGTNGNLDTVSVCFEFMANQSTPGIIVFNVRTDKLTKQLLANDGSNTVSLIASDGSIAYSSKSELIGKHRNTGGENTPEPIREKIGNYLTLSSPLADAPCTLELTVDLTSFNRNTVRLRLLLVLCILLAILLPIILASYISLQFYRSIENIIVNLSVTENAENIKTENMDELMFITRNITRITDKNANIEEKLVQQISELKRLQSYALQMQFNPHFLFNTLNLISVTVMNIAKGNNPASRTIRLLSELLTVALNNKEFIVSVEDEIGYAKKYVNIEAIRQHENFDVFWNIAEDAKNLKTTKLILQPIIENAFEHGINLCDDKRGILNVCAYRENNNLVITVENNGASFDKAKLSEITEKLKNNDIPDSKHIGLCNVNQRIKLIFGEQYGISIFADENHTIVTLTQPIIENDQNLN